MVSGRTVGGLLVAVTAGFSGVLYIITRSLQQTTTQLGCMADTPGCVQAVNWLSASHIAVGFMSALFSLGVYFLFFHKDLAASIAQTQQRTRDREEQIALLSKVLTSGESALLQAIVKDDGITQSTLAYRADLTPGRVSQILSQFEEQGVITRKPHGKTYKVHLCM